MATSLVDTCQATHVTRDVPVVEGKLGTSRDTWTNAKEVADEKKAQIVEAQNVLKKFENVVSPLEDSVKSCAKRCKKPKELGSKPENMEKYLTKLQVCEPSRDFVS